SSRRTRLPPIGASLPRLGAATPRASPQFTSELAIERQHYGLVGDLLAGVEEGDSAARERAVAVGKARRVLDLEFLRAREGVGKIQEPARADGVGRADPRRAAPHPIVIRGHHYRRQESRGFTSDGWVQYEAQSGRREVRLYRLRRVQLQEGILQVQDHQHHGCGASLRAVKFGLPRRLRDGHGPGVFAIPIRWSAAIGEACGWRGIARTK